MTKKGVPMTSGRRTALDARDGEAAGPRRHDARFAVDRVRARQQRAGGLAAQHERATTGRVEAVGRVRRPPLNWLTASGPAKPSRSAPSMHRARDVEDAACGDARVHYGSVRYMKQPNALAAAGKVKRPARRAFKALARIVHLSTSTLARMTRARCSAVEARVDEAKADLVVISGDFTQRARTERRGGGGSDNDRTRA